MFFQVRRLFFRTPVLGRIDLDAFPRAAPIRSVVEKNKNNNPSECVPILNMEEANPAFVKNPHNPSIIDSILFEWKDRLNVGLVTYITHAIFIGSDSDIADNRIFTYILLKRLELQELCAPAHLRRRKVTTKNRVPVVESSPGIKADNFLSRESLDAIEVFVGFRQLLLRVAEDIFHL